jgi:hypothetical protein
MMTETDPVSETSCFLFFRIWDYGKSPKPTNSVSFLLIHKWNLNSNEYILDFPDSSLQAHVILLQYTRTSLLII